MCLDPGLERERLILELKRALSMAFPFLVSHLHASTMTLGVEGDFLDIPGMLPFPLYTLLFCPHRTFILQPMQTNYTDNQQAVSGTCDEMSCPTWKRSIPQEWKILIGNACSE